MPTIPTDAGFDHTRALLADPYRFVSRRCAQHGADLFETRIMLRRTICMHGARAAELFYAPARFVRRGAQPEPMRATLLGKGGIQGLDDIEHRHRKAMFMTLVARERVAELAAASAREWEARARQWEAQERIELYRALQELLARAVCDWAGVPLPEGELPERSEQLAALYDQGAAVGFGHLNSRLARKRLERWAGGLVQDIRAGRADVARHCPVHVIAMHRDTSNELLAPSIAAVELLNVLRPTVAVSVFIVFAAHALHRHPECWLALRNGEPRNADCFVQEVRRWYPFFPAVMARVRDEFEWDGYRFPRGRQVMLDLYGTDHDPRAWDEPDEFRPERFRERAPTPFNFIPQGGGEPHGGHRCPGEDITAALMKVAIDFLVNRLRYDVPAQNLDIDFARLPALPRDGFTIAGVRLER